jgi:hypothetical protein
LSVHLKFSEKVGGGPSRSFESFVVNAFFIKAQGLIVPTIIDIIIEGVHGEEVYADFGNISPGPIACLKLMAEFVAEPESAGPRWLRNGGLQTLLSYGVGGIASTNDIDGMVEAAERLAELAGPDLAMMQALPVWKRYGQVLFSHAGADPELPPELQSDETLTWGTPRFFQLPRKDGLWCVYGHYVVDEAHASQGRIAVDTGAYHSGVLSAVRLDGPEPGFLTT